MNKARSGARSRLKNSRWELQLQSATQRKSMSLHDLTDTPPEPFNHIVSNQNTSLLTLDSIPKSRDSGLSRSASRLSLPSIGPAITESSPRSRHAHHLHKRTSCSNCKRNAELLKEKERELHLSEAKYTTLFTENQALKLKCAAMQIEIDHMRLTVYNKNSPPPQQLVSNMHKSKTHDGFFSDFHLNDEEKLRNVSMQYESETSISEYDDDMASSLNYATNSSSSDEETKDETIRKLDLVEPVEELPLPVPDVPTVEDKEVAELSSMPCASNQNPCMQPKLSWAGIAREEMILSPVPSSGKWTLDKSIQLVSDSDISEPGEEEGSLSISVNTDETGVRSRTKSEETLRGTEYEEVEVPQMSMDDSHPSIHLLPIDNSVRKTRNWRDKHFPQSATPPHEMVSTPPRTTEWTPCKKGRPQNLTLSMSPGLQRLRSPQNMTLLSPRPFQRQLNSPYHTNTLVVPPLDLSVLHSQSDGDSGTAEVEERSSNSPQQDEPSSSDSSTSHQLTKYISEADARKVEHILRITNRNYFTSTKILKNLHEKYG
ncbi:hypothetical protein B566_EDAN004753 [Ephemera danica]|nr:hypothetical protein B566_EDAN004753 [Ephemera danica]